MPAPGLGQIAGVSAQLSYGCLPGRAQVPVSHTEIEDPAVNDGAVVLVQVPRAVAVEPNHNSGQKPGERGDHPARFRAEPARPEPGERSDHGDDVLPSG